MMRPSSSGAGVLLVFALLGTLARDLGADPLWTTELRAGYGISAGGGQGVTTTRLSPLVLEGQVAVAIHEEPRVLAYGGVVFETLDRSAVGASFGARLRPAGSAMRVSGGGVWLVAPYSLWGALASVGRCFSVGTRRGVCGDAQVTSYFAGSDLAPGHTVLQAQLVVGFAFEGP